MGAPLSAPLSAGRIWALVRDPAPGRLGQALRMAGACTVTVLVGEIWQVPDLGVPALVTMALWQKDRVTNVIAGVAVNLLVVVLLAVIYGLVRFTLDRPLAFVLSIAVLSFCFFFLGSASKLKPVAYMLGLIVVYGLVALEEVPIGELVTRALLYTDLFTLVPGTVMVVLGLLICPSPRRVLTDGIAARLRVSAGLLRGAGAREQAHAVGLLREGAAGMSKALRMAGLERLWRPEDLACLGQAASCAVAVLALAEADAGGGGGADGGEAPEELIALLERMADVFAAGAYPVGIGVPAVPSGRPALQAIAGLMPVFTTPEAAGARREEKKKGGGFFLADAFTNPDHVRFAVKGTAGVMCSYVLFRSLDWPGIHTCIITCFIVALPTMGEMISKLTLRIIGASVGGAIGILSIVFMMPHLQGITGFLVLIFVVSLLAAWIRIGDERIAYAGFQIGLAFYLSDLSSFGPTTDMETARDRVVGVLIGNFITYAMFTSFWPSSAYAGIGGCLDRVIARLRQLGGAATPQARADGMAALQSAVSDGERQVEYALAEPPHMRREMAHLGALQEALAEAARLGIGMIDGEVVDPARRIAALEGLIS
ncbi:hypothetical protein GLI01_31680 [Gluconacetobacter liquefaciens]|nr:FUSC family protein [Gluconacetobacter liquefaciens]GEB39133.1 hypothetical protein GLI01_31680 [Gluconacetobacter liquefaciens]